uniref:Uncharacterized protein n=1 Tax=Rhizophora mucronata TaxID=61149 RepID=A0A2P2QX17_RHIMU
MIPEQLQKVLQKSFNMKKAGNEISAKEEQSKKDDATQLFLRLIHQ